MTKNAVCFKIFIFILILFIASIAISMTGINFHFLEDDIILSTSELENIKPYPPLSLEIKGEGQVKTASFKCCNVTIKDVNLEVIDNNFVYLGGKPLGIQISPDGLIVSQKINVVTSLGLESPLKDVDIQKGDVLTHINGIRVKDSATIAGVLASSKGSVTLSLKRNGSEFHVAVTPALDSLSNTRKLGMWLKDDIQGIGTLTYINPLTLRYGALGHVIKDTESGAVYNKPTGKIFDSTIHNVVKGERGKAGELNGSFSQSSKPLGTIDGNCDFGIFGDYSGSFDGYDKIQLGSKYSVHPGKAYIYTTIKGEKPDKYEIEIIKNNMQTCAKTKGMLIRVTDKRLLNLAGGIVQGMSGSPIIQNNKLVGAVTHVFIGDPTKGYGTYVDWMLPN